MKDLKTYKVGTSIFIPTKDTLDFKYTNGNIGDALWCQIYEGVLTGNRGTLKEILNCNPTVVLL